MRRDADAKSAVERSKNDFYSKYSYLKPECEKNAFEHICDGIVTAAKWCKEHWKLIVTAIIVVVAVVLLCTGVGSGLGAVLLAGACWGAIMGACIGGVAGNVNNLRISGTIYKLMNGSFLKKQMAVLSESEAMLTEKLTGEEKRAFLSFVNASDIILGESELDSFIVGFRLGTRIIYDTFVSDDTSYDNLLKEQSK